MDIPASAETPDRLLSSELEPEVKQDDARLPSQLQVNAERIRSSVTQLTSSSINELEGLTSELQQLQEFLSSEAERVQREIESALAGTKIIVETSSVPTLIEQSQLVGRKAPRSRRSAAAKVVDLSASARTW